MTIQFALSHATFALIEGGLLLSGSWAQDPLSKLYCLFRRIRPFLMPILAPYTIPPSCGFEICFLIRAIEISIRA